MDKKQAWHSVFYRQAYSDFSASPPLQAAGSSYWMAVGGNVLYRACLIVFWATLNVFTTPFGVFVEPLWRQQARFRRLQFPGRIPVIAVALPILLSFAAYRTAETRGVWHVVLPFVAMALGGALSLALLVCFQLFQRRERSSRRVANAVDPPASIGG